MDIFLFFYENICCGYILEAPLIWNYIIMGHCNPFVFLVFFFFVRYTYILLISDLLEESLNEKRKSDFKH